jgi:hypothetical protein
MEFDSWYGAVPADAAMTDPLRRSCAWCHPPGSPDFDRDATHGMCPRHAREILLVTPLLAVLATLRSVTFMGNDDRAKCARFVDSVLSRLARAEELHLFDSTNSAQPSAPDATDAAPRGAQSGPEARGILKGGTTG